MSEQNLDPNERIAGFALPRIQHALTYVGMLEGRDDIKTVAESLGCGRGQAERILETLERKGYVRRASKKSQWEKTPEGNAFVWRWKAPRPLTPAIEREHPTGQHNQGFESVPCSIWRSDDDDNVMFEEGVADVTCWVEYEGDRLIELSITQPSDPERPFDGGTLENSIYLSPADAKKFADGLLLAIAAAEKEISLRSKVDARRADREAKAKLKPPKVSRHASAPEPAPPPVKPERKVKPRSPARALTERKDHDRPPRSDKRAALKATLAELRETTR